MRTYAGRGVFMWAIFICLLGFTLSACAQQTPDPASQPISRSLAAENEIGFFGTIPMANASYRADATERQFYIFGCWPHSLADVPRPPSLTASPRPLQAQQLSNVEPHIERKAEVPAWVQSRATRPSRVRV
jgi:hypothetical protein